MEPIENSRYWKRRLEEAKKTHLHHAVFKCSLDKWRRIEEKHRQILASLIKPEDSILDCGCGYGRLIDLLPEKWLKNGNYIGVDLSSDLIELARQNHQDRAFIVGDLRYLPIEVTNQSYDIAIFISIRPMIIRNLGQEEWDKMEAEIKKVSKCQLYLEYDENAEGELKT